MLPDKVVYMIELHKFEIGLIFYMSVAAVSLPLFAASQHILSAPKVSAATKVRYPEIRSHTDVTIDPSKGIMAAASQQSSLSAWPLHGMITTEYGEPHRPWQTTHTGIDISSGQPSGRASVSPFREGTVTAAVRSSIGYGNHVIIDHGNGLTSLYGHMERLSVSPGQHVQIGDIIGYEGSTGTSTGTHLHFELEQDGRPINPRRYLAGNP